MEGFSVRVATADDAGAVFALVNDAYKVESGDSGIAFKRTPRFVDMSELLDLLPNVSVIVRSGDDGHDDAAMMATVITMMMAVTIAIMIMMMVVVMRMCAT